jgi:hypothetical protein
MAEYVQHITICDKCRAGEQGEGLLFHPFVKLMDRESGKFSNVMVSVPGVFRGAFDLAATMGWDERDYGHICPRCIVEEQEEEEFNGTEGTVTGALYESHLFGTQPEEVVNTLERDEKLLAKLRKEEEDADLAAD